MRIFSSYRRAVPRDLFNEANLLKGLGRLCLLCFDGKIELTFSHAGDGFHVEQDQSSGELRCPDVKFFLRGRELLITSSYNDRTGYTLLVDTDGDQLQVLTESGEPTAEFLSWLAE